MSNLLIYNNTIVRVKIAKWTCCFSLFQNGHERLQNASGGQRPLVSESTWQLQSDGAQTPQRVGEGADRSQEVCFQRNKCQEWKMNWGCIVNKVFNANSIMYSCMSLPLYVTVLLCVTVYVNKHYICIQRRQHIGKNQGSKAWRNTHS